MKQKTRIFAALGIILVIIVIVVGIDYFQREAGRKVIEEITLEAGDIPIYMDGELVAAFAPVDLESVEQTSFIDAEEGKTQEGWYLAEILTINLSESILKPETRIVVSSSSRGKTAELTWEEISNLENMILFDLSNKGTLKLVSLLEKLDVRDEWVQDTDKIEVFTP